MTRTETLTRTERSAVGLPEAVEAKRAAILDAAASGDVDAVAALAGEQFSYSFGGPVEGGPATHWRQLEDQGEQPLEVLAAILQLPYTLSRGIYVWPFAHDRTEDELSPHERSLLDELPARAAPFGQESYLGWRAGIEPDGDWIFFVAGD